MMIKLKFNFVKENVNKAVVRPEFKYLGKNNYLNINYKLS